jgi:glycogen debranching enzyme
MKSGLEHKIKHLYLQNRRTCGEYTYTIPSKNTYPYQWLWDSCFMSIAMSHFDLLQAKNELRALVSRQLENGMIPHIIYWQHTDVPDHLKIAWGKRGTSSITQPPLLAEAVQRIYDTDGDIDFVREMLPHIHTFHQFFYRKDLSYWIVCVSLKISFIIFLIVMFGVLEDLCCDSIVYTTTFAFN